MTVQSGQILGQDIIYYTSPGGTSNLRITQAVDIKAEQAEYEVNRQRNAAKFYGYSYDMVNVKGVLDVTNYKNAPVTLTVTKMLSGEVVSAGHDAKIEKIAKGLKKVNSRCRLTWEIPVKTSEKIQIEYQYTVYVRN
jgi:folylpolyglutamate synthase/dihydropteroate synthase